MSRMVTLLMAVALCGCSTIERVKDAVGIVTGAGIEPPPSVSTVAPGEWVRPTIAIGPGGRIAIAAEGPKMASIHLWLWTRDGWQGTEIARASKETAGRCYVADAVYDADGNLYVSWRWGKKEYGKLHGPGIYILQPGGKAVTVYPGVTSGAARLAVVGGKVTVFTKDGANYPITASGAVGPVQKYPAGSTGEKFDVAADGGTVATVMNGYSAMAGRITIGGKVATWADYAEYDEQGYDLCCPSVAINGGRAWCASELGGRLRVNSFDGKALGWPSDALLDVGAATHQERCPPRLYAASGAVYAVWTHKGVIYRKRLPDGQQERIASGSMPSVCNDGEVLHVAYVLDGIKYLRLEGEQGHD